MEDGRTNPRAHEALDLVKRRSAAGVELIEGLTDAQLGLETRPPRAQGAGPTVTIERVLTGRYDAQRVEIEANLSVLA